MLTMLTMELAFFNIMLFNKKQRQKAKALMAESIESSKKSCPKTFSRSMMPHLR